MGRCSMCMHVRREWYTYTPHCRCGVGGVPVHTIGDVSMDTYHSKRWWYVIPHQKRWYVIPLDE